MKSYSDTENAKSPFITSLDTNILVAADNNDLQTIKKLLNDETQFFNIFEAVNSKNYTSRNRKFLFFIFLNSISHFCIKWIANDSKIFFGLRKKTDSRS